MGVKTHILKGTREEIISQLSAIEGDIQKVVVIVEEKIEPARIPTIEEFEADLEEMRPFMDVDVDDVVCASDLHALSGRITADSTTSRLK